MSRLSDKQPTVNCEAKEQIPKDTNETNLRRISTGMQVLDNQGLIRPASKLFYRKFVQALTVPPDESELGSKKPPLFDRPLRFRLLAGT